jgi:transposase InsO family protein
MAQVTAVSVEPERIGGHVFLNEERVKVQLGDEAEPVDAPWYLDTGASNHMTDDRTAFADLDDKVIGSVKFGDNSVVSICGRGTVMFTSRGGEHRALTEVYFIPRLKTSIIGLGQLDENGCETMIRDGTMYVRDRSQRLLAKVTCSRNRLYRIALQIAQPVCLSARRGNDAWRWHKRLGQQHFGALEKMAHTSMVRGLPKIDHVDELCDAYLAGKQRRAPFPQTAKFRATKKLELVHGDLCGPISPPTPGGKRYFLLLVDDHSRYMWLTLLASKDEAEAAIKHFKARAEVQSGCKLHTLRTDRGGEFTSKDFKAYCAEHGIQRHMSAPYSPQWNGVVERRNQMVVAMARSMLKARGVPSRFWGEAMTTAVYILNRSYTRNVDNKTLYEVWHGKKPNVHYLRVFGCVAHVKTAHPQLKKLDDRSMPMVLMGYDAGSKAYKLYDPVSQRAHVSRDVVFDEDASWEWAEQADAHPAQTFTIDLPVLETTGNDDDIADDGGAAFPPPQPEEPATPVDVPAAQRVGQGAPVEFVTSSRSDTGLGGRRRTPPQVPHHRQHCR